MVIPTFNEKETIAEVIVKTGALPVACQIIVIDDGSTDGTRALLEKIDNIAGVKIILHDSNRGKGAALRSGFRHIQGRYVVIQDADLEYHPRDIAALVHPLWQDQADVVYGSHFLDRIGHTNQRGQHPRSTWLHRMGNRWLTLASNWCTGLKLTDMETCYKAMKAEWLEKVQLVQDGFGVEPELTAKLARCGARFSEVSTGYDGRSYRQGKKVGVKDLFNAIWCIVRYGWND